MKTQLLDGFGVFPKDLARASFSLPRQFWSKVPGDPNKYIVKTGTIEIISDEQ